MEQKDYKAIAKIIKKNTKEIRESDTQQYLLVIERNTIGRIEN